MQTPRWALPISFIALAGVTGFLAYFYRGDATWLQVWIGVALTFLTAGVVDGVALADAKQRERESEARMEPLRAIIRERLHHQRKNVVSLAALILGEDPTSDPLTEPEGIRSLPNRRLTFTAQDGVPGGRLFEMRQHQLRILSAQRDLENLTAADYRAEQIVGLSRLIRGGRLMPFVEGVLANNAGSWTAQEGYELTSELRDMIAGSLEELSDLGLP